MLPIISVNRPAEKVKQINYDAHLNPLVSQLPLTSCEVCVIVPVRNEAFNLEATLLALTNQINLEGKELDKNRYEIIILANNCTDNSAEVARRFAQTQPNLVLHVVEMTLNNDRAHIGWVRKILMDEAYRRFKAIGRNFGVIASTDGDTRVASTWIAATLAEIKNGADAVGGRIITNNQERSKLNKNTRLYYLRHLRYGYLTSQLESYLDPDFESLPRHHHHYAASLAVTAQMYAQVGGLPPLRSSEDVALYDALKRADARFRHSPMVRVITSARAIGRVEAGLSNRLSQLNVMAQKHQSILVESAELVAIRFCLRRWLRYLWQNRQHMPQSNFLIELAIIAQKLNINSDLLTETLWRSPTFGLVVEEIGQYQQDNNNLDLACQKVTIQQANADLRNTINRISHLGNRSMLEQSQSLSLGTFKQIKPISLVPQPL
ncbi:MAG TPA: glycosyltransferase [Coleofasciculaceae cyanobacterium]|jgi:glycosyltransferase involved in cell wall biosynthesis